MSTLPTVGEQVEIAKSGKNEPAQRFKARSALSRLDGKLAKLINLAIDEDADPAVREYLREYALEADATSATKKARLELVMDALYARALAGDVRAMQLFLDRTLGKQGDGTKHAQLVNQVALYVSQLAPAVANATSHRPMAVASTPEIGCTPSEPRLGDTHAASQPIDDVEFTDV